MSASSTPEFWEHRLALVAMGRRLYERGYIVAGDGNLSVRLGETILISPSGFRKGELKPEHLLRVRLSGEPFAEDLASGLKPSSELGLHLSAYRGRPATQAVIHAHPPILLAHALAGIGLSSFLPEVYLGLGEVVTLPYAMPGSEAVGEAVQAAAAQHVAMILSRHGSVTLGASLDEAFDRLEIMEQAARISLATVQLSGAPPTPLGDADRLALQSHPAFPQAETTGEPVKEGLIQKVDRGQVEVRKAGLAEPRPLKADDGGIAGMQGGLDLCQGGTVFGPEVEHGTHQSVKAGRQARGLGLAKKGEIVRGGARFEVEARAFVVPKKLKQKGAQRIEVDALIGPHFF